MDLVSLVEVGEVYFDGWKRNGLDDVVERHAREAEPGRIDDRAINIIDVRLKGIMGVRFPLLAKADPCTLDSVGVRRTPLLGQAMAFALIRAKKFPPIARA